MGGTLSLWGLPTHRGRSPGEAPIPGLFPPPAFDPQVAPKDASVVFYQGPPSMPCARAHLSLAGDRSVWPWVLFSGLSLSALPSSLTDTDILRGVHLPGMWPGPAGRRAQGQGSPARMVLSAPKEARR